MVCILLALAFVLLVQLTRASPLRSPSADQFFVDGTSVPGVPFSVPDSWAGLLPVSSDPSEDKKLFFWLHKAECDVGQDDLVIWLNGGPGCSSLEGALQENGPWILPYGAKTPELNPYSITKLSNVLYVDNPVGTGLSVGTATATDELGMAQQFYGFLISFFATFPELKGKRLWLHCESYAASYAFYIADVLLQDSATAYGISYQGLNLVSPGLFNYLVQMEYPSIEFAEANQSILRLNDSFLGALKNEAKAYGVDGYVAKNLIYPPKGPIDMPFNDTSVFDAWVEIVQAATDASACFSQYKIDATCADSAFDALGFPLDADSASANNFVNNISGFRTYIHADPATTWYECNPTPVFVGNGSHGDDSPWPSETDLMQRILERSPAQRNIVQVGSLDFHYLAAGVQIGFQNVTWNNLQGYQTPPQPFIVGGRAAGVVNSERGLTLLKHDQAGHMIPQDQRAAYFRVHQFMLGHITLEDLYSGS